MARAYVFLPLCHLSKVLIHQSASARAGANRTFSDQYLGQVPGEEGIFEKKRSRGVLHFHISLGECLWFVGSVSGWSCANGTLGVGFDHGYGLACSCLLGTIAEMLTPAGPVTCQDQGPRLGRSSWRGRAYFSLSVTCPRY